MLEQLESSLIELVHAMILLVLNLVLFLTTLKLSAYFVKKSSQLRYRIKAKDAFTIGFFHPFCNSGGGGERVLWSAVKIIQEKYSNCTCVIYTGDCETEAEVIIKNASERLNIQLDPERTKFIYLRLRFLTLDKYYPAFTLLGQSIGSVILGIEAFLKFVPDVYFETTGYAFTYPLFYYICGIPVACYTHYPTISSDMLQRVSEQNVSYNNRRLIGRSPFLTKCKLVYYRMFAKLYSLCGRCSDCVMVNSSWTQSHINEIWSLAYRTRIVYPPCDVSKFETIFQNDKHDKNFYVSSVAQIRPEKNHQLQIKSFAKFLNKVEEEESKENLAKIKLFIIGSCRNEDDKQRADNLKQLAKDLNIQDHVELKLNFKFEYLLQYLSESAVGLHTMIDEHFGIGVVECMAAGLVTIAHNSAGPKMDIVVPYKGEKSGYLAETEDEYADCFYSIYKMPTNKRDNIRQAAKQQVKKFSQEKFNENFLEVFNELCLFKYFKHLSKDN